MHPVVKYIYLVEREIDTVESYKHPLENVIYLSEIDMRPPVKHISTPRVARMGLHREVMQYCGAVSQYCHCKTTEHLGLTESPTVVDMATLML